MFARSLRWLSAPFVALAACQGGGGANGVDVTPPEFSIALSVSPTDVSIPIGGRQTLSVNVTRGGGYQGGVSFVVDGLPSYVTASFEPSVLWGTTGQATLTLVTTDEAPAGVYPIVVRARGDVVTEKSVTVNCTLVRVPGFTLSAAAPTVSVERGGTAQLGVGVGRTGGFTGAVNLAVDNAPAGLTASFAPNPATADQSMLTLSAASTLGAGTYSISIHGTATGAPDKSAALTVTVVETMGFTISLDQSALTLVPPASGTVGINVQRVGGFTGAVSLFAEGFPTGVTASINPNPATGASASLTLTASPAVSEGTYTMYLRGEAAGRPTLRVPLQLTIQSAPGYLLTISNPQMTLAPGGSAQTLNVSIQRVGGFTGAVTFALSGLPGGFTSSFSPTTTTGTSTVLSVAAAAAVAPGSYIATITGTAPGLADRTTTIGITVIASGTTIAWRFCSSAPQPVFFAYADGASPYAAVARGTDGSYTMSLASGRGTVVWVEPTLPTLSTDAVRGRTRAPTLAPRAAKARSQRSTGQRRADVTTSGFTTYVQYGTTSELQAMAQPVCPSSAIAKTVFGSVANLGVGQGFGVGLGTAFALGMPGTTSYTLTGVPDGAHDLLAGRVTITMADPLLLAIPDRLIVRRNQNPSDGATLPLLDFAAAESFAPAHAALTLTGTNGALIELSGAFSTTNGTYAFINGGETSTSTNWTYFGLPSAQLVNGDLHWIIASDDQDRTGILFAHDVTPRTLALGPIPTQPQVNVYATSPVVRTRAQLTLGQPGTEYGGSFETTFLQSNTQRAFVMSYTRGAIGTSTFVEIRTPVLTGLPGWDESRYGFQLGSAIDWAVQQWSVSDTYVPADGGSLRYVLFQGQLIP